MILVVGCIDLFPVRETFKFRAVEPEVVGVLLEHPIIGTLPFNVEVQHPPLAVTVLLSQHTSTQFAVSVASEVCRLYGPCIVNSK